MAQHDFNIANQVPANLRSDLNNALSAIATNNSGASAPSTTFANQWWYDTTNDLLKIRNEADTAWITLGELNQASGVWKPYVNGKQIADFLDEDNMASDSATAVPSQQSVKAYVDANGITQTTGTPPYYGARAWGVSTGVSSPTILASGNISSVAYVSTGRIRFTFTTPMPDANYAVVATANRSSANDVFCHTEDHSTTSFDVFFRDQYANLLLSVQECSVVVFR